MENQKILAKLWSIMQSVDRIQKDSYNKHGNYEYASEKAIKETMHQELVANKVVFNLQCMNPRLIDLQEGKDGKVPKIMMLDFTYCFTDVESGQAICGEFVACGNGRDDKGTYAAITNAIKYILTSTFLIPTGDDVEGDGHKPQPKALPTQEKPVEQPPAQPKKEEKPVTKKKATTKKKVTKKKAAPKPAPEPEPEVEEPAPDPEPENKYGFGEPEGERIDASTYKKIVNAFAKYDVDEDDLQSIAGLPVDEWTENIKKCAYNNYKMMKAGEMTKEDLLS